MAENPTHNNKIQKDQKKFFNEHSDVETVLTHHSPLLDSYANKEQYEGFEWIENSHTILDYGCGTATSVDRFLFDRDPNKYKFIGVDIADKALGKAKIKYPNYEFYPIENNKLDQVADKSIDAAYIIHVLHHSTDHEKYINEIYKKLKPNGKLLLNDLSSKNPIINLGRATFGAMPKFVKNKFSNDLVVNDSIPDKYPVDVDFTVKILKDAGFKIVKVGHAHLFFFLFLWLDNFAKFSNNKIIAAIYKQIIKFESFLLQFDFFKKYAELFYIYAIKPDAENKLNVPESGDYSSSLNQYVYNLVPENSKCLDVGCWNGNLGAKLISDKNCKVEGIDVNDKMLKLAKDKGYDSVYNINLNDSDSDLDSINTKYDVIIFADLLEHLIDPEKALTLFKEKLSENGIIIISLPNVAFILNRFNLLFGKWDYREFGTLDKTHLKFFTIKTVINLVKKAGYKIKKVKPYNQFGILEKMDILLEISPELFAYQIIVVASKNGK